MPTNNAWLSDTIRLCGENRVYVQLLQNSVFAHISDQTTAAQFAAAEQSIRALGERLAAPLDPLHFGVLTGTHQCIPEITELACTYLANLAMLRPEPPRSAPPAPPAPTPQPLTDEELMERLKNYVEERTKETFFGQDQEEEEESA